MIYLHKFSLRDFLDNSKYLYNYYDILLGMESSNKEEILEKVDISARTYRDNKSRGAINLKIFEKLNDYFKIEEFNEAIITESASFLASLFYRAYYNPTSDFIFYEEQIQYLLEKNTIFKPLFLLFDLLIKMLNNRFKLGKTLNDFNKEYELVKSYRNLYEGSFLSVFYILKIVFEYEEGIMKKEVKHLMADDSYFKGWMYHLLVTNLFLNKKYDKALNYATLARTYFIREKNFKRVCSADGNISIIYIHLKEYKLAFELSSMYMNKVRKLEVAYIPIFKLSYYISMFELDMIDELEKIINHSMIKGNYECTFMIFIMLIRKDMKQFLNNYDELTKKAKSENDELTFSILKHFRRVLKNGKKTECDVSKIGYLSNIVKRITKLYEMERKMT